MKTLLACTQEEMKDILPIKYCNSFNVASDLFNQTPKSSKISSNRSGVTLSVNLTELNRTPINDILVEGGRGVGGGMLFV